MSTSSTGAVLVTLEQAHGTVMIFAWIVFASTGILFARYGRSIHFGNKGKIFGLDVWFQMHRSIVILAAITTLAGLILIFVKGDNSTVENNRDKLRVGAHQVFGFGVAGGTALQVVMGLFRCSPQSTYRFIFNWIHRIVGILAFASSILALFLILSVLKNNLSGLMIILSIWVIWVLIVVIILEIIKYRDRSQSAIIGPKVGNDTYGQQLDEINSRNNMPERRDHNNLKLFWFFAHFIVAISLSIALIVIIWQQ